MKPVPCPACLLSYGGPAVKCIRYREWLGAGPKEQSAPGAVNRLTRQSTLSGSMGCFVFQPLLRIILDIGVDNVAVLV